MVNPKYKIAVYIKDITLAVKFLLYTESKFPEDYQNILCAVCESNEKAVAENISTPVVSLNWAMRKYEINLILVISSDMRPFSEITENKYTQEAVKVVELLSRSEKLFEI